MKGPPYKYPEEGPLPKERVANDFVFSYIGIDLAEPIYVKPIYNKTEAVEMHKAWIVVITCATSRCIYLDLVPDCSGTTLIDTLKRYISRHSAPKVIISDNGKKLRKQRSTKLCFNSRNKVEIQCRKRTMDWWLFRGSRPDGKKVSSKNSWEVSTQFQRNNDIVERNTRCFEQ